MNKTVSVALFLMLSVLTFLDAQTSCTTPPAPYVGTGTFCGCGQVVAKARRNPQIVGKTFVWYDNANRTGTPLPSTMSLENDVSLLSSLDLGIPFNVATTTSKTVWAFEKDGDCYSIGSPVVLTVFPIPQATPTLPNNSVRACQSGTLTATPTATGHKIDWWTTSNQTPGTRVAEGSTYTLINNTNSLISQSLFVYEYTEEACGSGDILRCYGPPATANIFVFPKLQVNAGVDVSICPGQTTTLTAVASGGDNGGYAYTWKRGTSVVGFGSTLSGVSIAGDYTVDVIDVNNCTASDIIKVSIGSTVSVNAGADVDICNGSSTTLSASATGGSGSFTYKWTRGGTTVGTTASISASIAGIYTVEVADANAAGCSATDNVEVKTSGNLPTPNVGAGAVCGCNQVIATVGQCTTCPTGATICWFDNATGTGTPVQTGGTTFTSTTSRTLYVFYKSGSCLSAGAKYILTVLPVPNITPSVLGPNLVTTIEGKEISNCATVTAMATPSTTGNTIEWWSTPNQTAGTQLATGGTLVSTTSRIVYVHEVKTETCASGDVIKCYGAPTVLKITVNPVPTVILGPDVSICAGSSTTITANVIGGTAPYTYAWTGGTTASSLTTSTAGTYVITVTDKNGCTSTDDVKVSALGSLTVNAGADVSICGNTSTILSASATGGTSPYTYKWSNAATTQTTSVSAAGIYKVTVTDSKGCTGTDDVEVKVGSGITVSAGADVSICGNTSTTLSASATGGTSPYTYKWSNAAMTQTTNISAAGTYKVTATDSKGCTGTDDVEVKTGNGVSFALAKIDVKCFGLRTGKITVTTATSGDYVYSRNGFDFQNSNIFDNLSAKSYTISVKLRGTTCISTQTIDVTEPQDLKGSVKIYDTPCSGETGKIVVTPTGGTAPYEYKLNSGTYGSSNTFSNLTKGFYDITVRDANGCTTFFSRLPINNPQALKLIVEKREDNKCFGDRNGRIFLKAEGGSGYETMTINNGLSFNINTNYSGLAAGTYICYAKDQNGCISNKETVVISQPSAVTFTATKKDISATATTGSINIVASGGTAPYAYSIQDGDDWQSSGSFSNLKARTYIMRVRDANGCLSEKQSIKIESAVVNVPPIYFSFFDKAVSCKGGSDGRIKLYNVGGGKGAPFQYSIDNGTTWSNSDLFENLKAGNYYARAKDKEGNLSPNGILITVKEPYEVVTFTAYKYDIGCGQTASGIILVYPRGGNGGYEYSSDGGVTFQRSSSFYSLAVGKYSIVVKDSKGCVSTATFVEIVNKCAYKPYGLVRAAPSQFIPVVMWQASPNPTTDFLEVELTSLKEREQEFIFFNTTGQPIMRDKRILQKGEQKVQFDCSNLPSGMYQIVTPGTISKTIEVRFIKM
jgi:hypothetical protein